MSDKLQFVVFLVSIRVEIIEAFSDKLQFVGQFAPAIVPRPFSPITHQYRFDWVIEDILNRWVKLPLADNMVKTFVLQNCPVRDKIRLPSLELLPFNDCMIRERLGCSLMKTGRPF